MADYDVVPYGQGPATPVTDEEGQVITGQEHEKQLDDNGFTNPNLHRRTDIPENPPEPEVQKRIYSFDLEGLEAYRYREVSYRDEDSDEVEIP